MNPQLA